MELSQVIHYYLGQPCLNLFFPDGHEMRDCEWRLTGIREKSYTKPYGLENSENATWTDSIKPILRKLEDMQEEELIGLLQIHVPNDMEEKPTGEDYDLDMFHNDGGNLVDADIAVGANYTCICYQGQIAIRHNGNIDLYDEAGIEEPRRIDQAKAFHYLLSRGFDLFGLIPSGQAIDAKPIIK